MSVAQRLPMYLAVQCIAYCVDMGGFLLLTNASGTSPVAANVASKFSAGIVAFWLHRRWTFRRADAAMPGQLARYWLLFAINLPVSAALLTVSMRWIAWNPLAKAVADVVGTGLTFLATQHVVFGAGRARGRPGQ